MKRLRLLRMISAVGCMAVVAAGAAARLAAAGLAQTPPQTGFVPADSLPPVESMPAGPLVLAAYAFVWVALATYVLFVARRAGRTERDLAEIRQRLSANGSSSART